MCLRFLCQANAAYDSGRPPQPLRTSPESDGDEGTPSSRWCRWPGASAGGRSRANSAAPHRTWSTPRRGSSSCSSQAPGRRHGYMRRLYPGLCLVSKYIEDAMNLDLYYLTSKLGVGCRLVDCFIFTMPTNEMHTVTLPG
jgi:hypothetical protein